MATTKTITIQTDGQLNSTAITVVVLFEPVGAYKTFDPIIWKVGSWRPTGEQSMNAFTWTSNYAFSALSDPEQAHCSIKNGQQTSLQKDPYEAYDWTDPKPIPGHPGSPPVASNMTGSKTNISFGFTVVDPSTDEQAMENAIVYENVADQKSVTASFSPTMNVYIFKTADLDKVYEEGQRLSSPLPASAKRWSKDLRTLDPTTEDLTLVVAYNPDPDALEYEVTQNDLSSFSAFQDPSTAFIASGLVVNPGKRQFNATIDIPNFSSEISCLPIIIRKLKCKGYDVSCTLPVVGGITVKFELGIPFSSSLSQAEKDLKDAFCQSGVTRFAITRRSGQILKYSIGVNRGWGNVSPASEDWNMDGNGRPCGTAKEENFASPAVARMTFLGTDPSAAPAAPANGTGKSSIRKKKVIM